MTAASPPVDRALPWLALLAAVVTGLSFLLGPWWWPFDLPTHFRPQLAAGALALLGLTLWRRRPRTALLAALVVAANAAPVLPYLPSVGAVAAGPGLRLLILNLHGEATDPAAFHALLAAERPDAVLLTELPADIERLTAGTAALPPAVVTDRRSSPFEVMLFSRWPARLSLIDRGLGPDLPILAAELCAPDAAGCLHLIGLHAVQPFGGGLAGLQRRQFAAVAARAAAVPAGRVVVAGDLNTTPFAPAFAALLEAGGLRDAARGQPWAVTWPATAPLLGIPIDHVLVGDGVAVRARRVGAAVGSDHRPVIADLSLR